MKSKFLPPTYFFVLLVLEIVLHFVFPISKAIHSPYTYVGFLFILIGVVFNVWSDLLIKQAKTTVKPYENPTALITCGPFAVTRNPQYLGFTAILLGVAVLHGTVSAFVGPILFYLAMELMFIPVEERNMEKAFGNKYSEYKSKVRQWI